jgi:hypothetical protein
VLGVLGVEVLLSRLLALQDPRAALRLTAFLVAPSHAIFLPVAALVEATVRRREREAEGGETPRVGRGRRWTRSSRWERRGDPREERRMVRAS